MAALMDRIALEHVVDLCDVRHVLELLYDRAGGGGGVALLLGPHGRPLAAGPLWDEAVGLLLEHHALSLDLRGERAGGAFAGGLQGYVLPVCLEGDRLACLVLGGFRLEGETLDATACRDWAQGHGMDPEVCLQLAQRAPRLTEAERDRTLALGGMLVGQWSALARAAHARRQAEAALQTSRDELLAVPEAVAALVATVDPSGHYLYVNRAYAEAFGTVQAMLHGLPFGVVLPASQRQRLLSGLSRALSGSSVTDELTLEDGTARSFHLTLRPLPGREGERRPLGAVVTLVDISEHRRTVQALGDNESRFRTLFENAPDAVFVHDRRGNFIDGNRAAESAVGYRREELIGRSFLNLDLLRPVEMPRAALGLARSLAGHAVGPEIYHLRHRDGHEVTLEIRTVPLVLDGITVVMGIARDVTRRLAEREERRLSDERFRTLAEHAPWAIASLAPDGQILDVNPAAVAMVGAPDAETLKQLNVLTDYRFEAMGLGPFLRRAFEQREPVSEVSTFTTSYGKTLTVRQHLQPVLVNSGPSEAGVLTGLFWLAEDITEHVQLEERMRHAGKMEAVGQLAGGVAHDFNNLLTTIRGFTEIIAASLEPDSCFQDDLAQILHASERAADLTRQLLVFSRRQVIEPRPLDLSAVLDSMSRMLRPVVAENVELELCCNRSAPPVLADASQVEQIVMNLVVNAGSAMPDGGHLTLAVEPCGPEGVPGPAGLGGDSCRYVQLRVSDTGCGMDEATQARIFEPFFTTRGIGEGTGLGLATVYGIVRQHKGYVTCESALGCGATFRIWLPVAGPAAPLPIIATVSKSSLQGRGCVLIVEDDIVLRRLTSRMLHHYGYDVREAATTDEALQLAATLPIDLLLTDVVMPGLNGRQLSEQVAEQRVAAGLPRLPVLYVSGYPESVIARHGVLEDGVAFLPKPFGAAELAARVSQLLQHSTPTDS